jgi:glycolate oxidase FAD binding subunit
MASERDRALDTAITRWGADVMREATAEDAVGSMTPRLVAEPPDVASLVEILRWSGSSSLRVLPCGGRTKLAWLGGTDADLLLSTRRLTRVMEHSSGDLTAAAQAGASIDAVNAVLGLEKQWLPLDPPFSDRATIGGVVATGDSGPRRHSCGAPRDQIIGIEMALADGRTARAGGRVVKNVAGYDLARLMCGSFGSLAVVLSATFKLAPIAPASRTMVARSERARSLADMALAIARTPLAPTAVELRSSPPSLMVRFETTPASAEHQAALAAKSCEQAGAATRVVADREESELWTAYRDRLYEPGAALLRVSMLPTVAPELIEQLEAFGPLRGVQATAAGRAALGSMYVRLDGEASGVAAAIADLAAWLRTMNATAVLLSGGEMPQHSRATNSAEALGVAIRAQFDPQGTLAGRPPRAI